MATNIETKNKDEEAIGISASEELQELKEETESGEYETIGEYKIMKDEKGKYIELEGKKYYENIRNGLGFSIVNNQPGCEEIYIGNFKNGKYEGKGKYIKYSRNYYVPYHMENYVSSYMGNNYELLKSEFEGNWKNGIKNGMGKYTYKNGTIYEGERVNNEVKEGKGIMKFRDGETFVGDFLIDKDGNPVPFYKIYGKLKQSRNELGDTESLNKDMEGVFTLKNNSRHEYKLINGKLHENATDFITMYGDKKPDEDWSKERGNIEYTINYSSDSHIEYKVTSWKGRHVKRTFNGNQYDFMDDTGNILSIPASSNFGEKEALHAGNLINGIRYFNETRHYSGKYRYDNNNICSTTYITTGHAMGGGIVYHESTSEANGITLLKDVKKHFGGISAGKLAAWLNNAEWESNKE